ncbi:MAG: hypothetical protein DME26_13700 [Verrucomicrobia bacterium]|nr:MAG: hypothetical protein DME26_13700 [Verrucomicrobiota bacterium]
MQSTEPLTPALSPSNGERECMSAPVERSPLGDSIQARTDVLPLPFLKGEGWVLVHCVHKKSNE